MDTQKIIKARKAGILMKKSTMGRFRQSKGSIERVLEERVDLLLQAGTDEVVKITQNEASVSSISRALSRLKQKNPNKYGKIRFAIRGRDSILFTDEG